MAPRDGDIAFNDAFCGDLVPRAAGGALVRMAA
jgi:hypothetical protein